MNLSQVLPTGALSCPWPTAIGVTKVSGHRMDVSGYCVKKCGASPQCHATDVPKGENLCGHGLSFFRHDLGGERITVFGLRGEKSKSSKNPAIKDALRGRSVTDAEFGLWLGAIEKLLDQISSDFKSRQLEMLDPLHDPIRLAKQIQQVAEKVVLSNSGGGSLDDAIERASPELKSLVKAADLLSDSFDMLSIYFNPESASYSRSYYMSLHGLLRKLVGIFSISDFFDQGSDTPRIYLSGSFHRSVPLRESFKLVPFALITNAIKYCVESPVRVTINELHHSVEVAVESVGPLIEPDELQNIFGKRFRGKWACKHSSGSGVGLYLADIVAKANGFTIKARSSPKGRESNGIPMATNRFSFEIPLQGTNT